MNKNNKYIVITTIFSPTEAVIKYSHLHDEYILVVVGDKKTPQEWYCNNTVYLPIAKQAIIGRHLHDFLPYNHYSRKMIGYLYSIKQGANYIIDTDDDNIPKSNWFFPDFEGEYSYIPERIGFINIYQLFTSQHIWPRGLHIKLINKHFDLDKIIIKKQVKIGVWQGLADEDPDVDAIYRLTIGQPCYFNDRDPVVLGKGTISPFNTQNTLIVKDLFPLLYLPTKVSFRFTDILRGLVAQPIMWLYGYHLGFLAANVIQKRNEHDYFNDFLLEIPMYKHCSDIVDIVDTAISAQYSISDNLYIAYEALEKRGIVNKKELKVVSAWLQDISIS